MRFILSFLVCLVCSPVFGAAHALMGAQFNPLRTEGATLKVWTSPSSPLNTLNGSGISELYDLSGNGNRLTNATAANQPALTNSNGRIVAYFDGVDDFLKTATFPLVQPTSVFMGLKQVTWTSADRIFDGYNADSPRVYQTVSEPTLRFYDGTSASSSLSTVSMGQFRVLSLLANGAASQLSDGLISTAVGSITKNMDGITIASAASALTGLGNIETSDILVFQGAPSEAWQRYNILGLARLNGINPFAP